MRHHAVQERPRENIHVADNTHHLGDDDDHHHTAGQHVQKRPKDNSHITDIEEAHEPMPITVEADKSAPSKKAAGLMDLTIPTYSSNARDESFKDPTESLPASDEEELASSTTHHINPFEVGHKNSRDEHGALIKNNINNTHETDVVDVGTVDNLGDSARANDAGDQNAQRLEDESIEVDFSGRLEVENIEVVDEKHTEEGGVEGVVPIPVQTENNQMRELTQPIGVHEPEQNSATAGERANPIGGEERSESGHIADSNPGKPATPVLSENNAARPVQVHDPEPNTEAAKPVGEESAFDRYKKPASAHSNAIRDVTDEIPRATVLDNAKDAEPEVISDEAKAEHVTRTTDKSNRSERELTNEASGATKYAAAGFPAFYEYADAAMARRLELWNSSDYREVSGRITLEFHLTRENCPIDIDTDSNSNSGKNKKRYRMAALEPSVIDVYDPPVAVIGTSHNHARHIKTGSISELVSHMAIWREVFVLGVNLNATDRTYASVFADGVSADMGDMDMDMGIDVGGDFDIALLSSGTDIANIDPFAAYVISVRGANRLLSLVTEFTVPLPELVDVLVRKHGLKVVRHSIPLKKKMKDERNGDLEIETEFSCTAHKLRDLGNTFNTASLPYYPPHHPFFEIINESGSIGQ